MTDEHSNPQTEAGLTAHRILCGIAALRAACIERGEYPTHGKHAVAALLCDMRAFCDDAGVDFEWCNWAGLQRFTEERPGDAEA